MTDFPHIGRSDDAHLSDPWGTLLGRNSDLPQTSGEPLHPILPERSEGVPLESFGPVCRDYRFGHVLVEVFPELVTIAVPYDSEHDDFCDASMFVERYTHCADAFVIEDDEQDLQLRIYPNVENLVAGDRTTLPGIDPRFGLWDPPRVAVPVEATPLPLALPLPVPRRYRMPSQLVAATTWYEQYAQEVVLRTTVNVGTMFAQHALTYLAR